MAGGSIEPRDSGLHDCHESDSRRITENSNRTRDDGEETMRAPGHMSSYQLYFRDPLTRKFVAVDGLVIKTVVSVPTTADGVRHHIPQLRRGIPSMSYRGNPIWPK